MAFMMKPPNGSRVDRSLSIVSGELVVRSCWYDSATSSASARSALLLRFWVQFSVARRFRLLKPRSAPVDSVLM